MHAILQQSEWRANQTAISSPAVAGWEMYDEIDMQQGPGQGYSDAKQHTFASSRTMAVCATITTARGLCSGRQIAGSAQFVNGFQDVVSADIYWFTDPNVSGSSEGGKLLNGGSLTPTQTRRAANYGYTVDRMRALDAMDGQRKPIWTFVEVGWPFSETAAQGAGLFSRRKSGGGVAQHHRWGARHHLFQPQFRRSPQSQHCLREPAYAAVRAAVKSTNQLITQLAPVLNAPFADGFVSADHPSGQWRSSMRTSTTYLQAAKKMRPAHRRCRCRESIMATATVIGENRTIAISNGRFSDSFADGNAYPYLQD